MGRPETTSIAEAEQDRQVPAGNPDGRSPTEPPTRPTRGRNPFRRRADYVAATLLVVVSLVVYAVLWEDSDIHNTTSATGSSYVIPLTAPTVFPPSLGEIWQADSGETPIPVAGDSTVITADDGTVTGRDPLSGTPRWHYTRDLGLCTVNAAWGYVLAVYRKSTNCSEVTALNLTTGVRGPQRNGDAPAGTQLVYDGVYVTATGLTLLDTWRSDLVQTTEYGTVPDFVNPNRQPRTLCTYGSVAAMPGEVGVIERCAGDGGDRLTVYRAAPSSADTPSVVFSTVVGDQGARLITMNDQYAAVVLPNPTRLAVFDAQSGTLTTQYPLNLPASDLNGNPTGLVVPASLTANSVYWFTGSSTISLSSLDFHPQWTVPNALGPGTVFAGRYLIPVPNALLVFDQATGAQVGRIAVDRHGYSGIVRMASVGPVVLEQRGGTLSALR